MGGRDKGIPGLGTVLCRWMVGDVVAGPFLSVVRDLVKGWRGVDFCSGTRPPEWDGRASQARRRDSCRRRQR